jgi:hypothetical protein
VDIVWTSDGRPCGRVSREAAKARRKGRRRFSVSSLAQVVHLPKTFCGNEDALECSDLTELWMVSSALIEKSKAVSSHRSPRKQDPESHAKTRRCERIEIEFRSYQ